MRFLLVAVVALVGCDGGVQCGSMQGFVTGSTASNAMVYARPAAGGDRVETTADVDGSYEINLDGGQEWILWAETDECFSADVQLTIDACEEYVRDIPINFDDCVTADKPNLYLYPDQPTWTSVTIEADPRQRIFASEPAYEEGWHGVAQPDGTFEVNGQRFPFLFYEITVAPEHVVGLNRQRGWCMAGADAVQGMADVLGQYGFNDRERADFVQAWQTDFPVYDEVAVYPQLRVDHMAGLRIEPALPVSRLWLLAEPAPGCHVAKAPEVVPFDRSGAHAVEWGVMLHR